LSARERHNVIERGSPDAQPMLFAHGFGCDQNMWRMVWPAFAADHRVVLFDLAGFGGSDPAVFDPARHSTLDGYAQDVLEICAELDLSDVVFVGHSVSAMIGALAAVAEPERQKLFVSSPPSSGRSSFPMIRAGAHAGDGALPELERAGGDGRGDTGLPRHVSEPDAESLFEDAPCGYLATELDGTIVRVNRTFEALTGFSRTELVAGRRFQELLAPGARIYHETHSAPLLRMQGAVREIALELVRADGTRLPTLVNATVHDGIVRTVVFAASDRRSYEQELVAGRGREREIAQRLPASSRPAPASTSASPTARACARWRSAETGTTPSGSRTARRSRSRSATSWAAGSTRRPPWVSCAARCGRSPPPAPDPRAC
jgi:PAS domain S-box-containing protein